MTCRDVAVKAVEELARLECGICAAPTGSELIRSGHGDYRHVVNGVDLVCYAWKAHSLIHRIRSGDWQP